MKLSGPAFGPVFDSRTKRRSPSARDLMGKLCPPLPDSLLRDAHVAADHLPIDHRAVFCDGGARPGGRGRTCRPAVRDEGNADRQRHAENNAEQHAHDDLPGYDVDVPRQKRPRPILVPYSRIETIAAGPEVSDTGNGFVD